MTPELINPVNNLYVRNAVDNLSWIDMGDFLIVVDALEQKSLAKEVSEMISSSCPGKPLKFLINTHCHHDHTALNAFFAAQGAEIISSRNSGEKVITGNNGITVKFTPFPGCHSENDVLINVPELKTLFTGDIFGWGLIPWEGTLTPAKVQHINNSYQRMIEIGAEIVVPGHGPIASTKELKRWLTYFNDLIAKKQKGLLNSKEPAPADMLNWWRFTEWKHQDTLHKLITAGRL